MHRSGSSASLARGLAAVGVFGPWAYIGLTIGLGLMVGGYDPVRDTQSELGAVDSPYRWVMSAGFMALGVSMWAFGGAYAMVLRGGWPKRVAVALLGLAGAGMVVVGFFPCDAGCVDVTVTGQLHGVFSMPGAIGLPAAAMVSAAVFGSDGRLGVPWQLVSFWLGALALASGPLIQAGIVEDANGLLQRAGMWPALIWMSAVAAQLFGFAGPRGQPALVSPL